MTIAKISAPRPDGKWSREQLAPRVQRIINTNTNVEYFDHRHSTTYESKKTYQVFAF